MSVVLLVRAVSDRFVDSVLREPVLAFALFERGVPPEAWNVNAVRSHEARREGLARAGVSFDADASELHDLGQAWDGFERILETLGADDANVFRAGTEAGDDEEAGVRVLASAATRATLEALERIDRASVERAARSVIEVSRTGGQRRNEFTGEIVPVRARELHGAGRRADDELVGWLADSFERLRGVFRDARAREFGLALRVVL